MFLGGLKTQIVVLITLALVGSVALYLGWDDNVSPYAKGSDADKLWRQCEQSSGNTRAFALCTCPVDQMFKDERDLLCLHLAVSQHEQRALRAGRTPVSPSIILKAMPKSCKDGVSKKDLAKYELIRDECNLRYHRKAVPVPVPEPR